MSIDAFELQGMQHCAVAGHFVVLVKRVAAHLAAGRPDIHVLKGHQGQFVIECRLGDCALLGAMGVAPKHAAFAHFLKVGLHRLGDDGVADVGQYFVPAADATALAGELRVGYTERFAVTRSEEHTSELQSLMRISYAVFCLKKKTEHKNNTT